VRIESRQSNGNRREKQHILKVMKRMYLLAQLRELEELNIPRMHLSTLTALFSQVSA